MTGSAYLASQDENPFGSLVAMYIVAKIRCRGRWSRSRAGQPEPGHGPARHDDRQQPTAAVRRSEAALLRRFTRAAGDPGEVRLLHDHEASFTPWSGNAEVPASSNSRSPPARTAALPRREPAVQAVADRRHHQRQRRRVHSFTMTISREDGKQSMQGSSCTCRRASGDALGRDALREAQANAGTCGRTA